MIEMTPEELAEAYYGRPVATDRSPGKVSSPVDTVPGEVNSGSGETAPSPRVAARKNARHRSETFAGRDVLVNLSALQVLELVHNLLRPDEHVRLERCHWPVDPADPDGASLNWYATVSDCHGYGTTILDAWTQLLCALIRRKFPHTI